MEDNLFGISLDEIEKAAMEGLDIIDDVNFDIDSESGSAEESFDENENSVAEDSDANIVDAIFDGIDDVALIWEKINNKQTTKAIKNFSERYLDLLDGTFITSVYEKFNLYSVEHRSYLDAIEEQIAIRNEKVNKSKQELQEGTDDIVSTISQLEEQKEKVKELCQKNNITLFDNDNSGKRHTEYYNLENLINSSKIDLFFYYGFAPSKKTTCQKVCQEEYNFVCSAIEKNNNRLYNLKAKIQEEISRAEKECELKCNEIENNISQLLNSVSAYIKSDDIQELNEHWDDYMNKYQISTLAEFDPNKNGSQLYSCLGFIHKHVQMEKQLIDHISNEFSRCNFFFFSNDNMVIQLPFFDLLTDLSNKYFIDLPYHSTTVQDGLQAYLLRLLSNSAVNEYDFVLMDPISNGKSFLDSIGLVHDDGYGIVNNIYCDKNEIAIALSELSNKIKEINQTIKGYSTIYEYNKDYPDNKINTTVFIAYNFCDEYYRDDLLSPIFDNASKCGITIFAITPFSGSFSVEKVKKVVSSYVYSSISYTDRKIVFDKYVYFNKDNEFSFTQSQANTVEWIEKYNDIMKKGVQICNTYKDIHKKLPDFYSLDSTSGLHIPFAVDNKNHIISLNLAVPMCYHAFISGQTGIGKSVLLHSIVSSVIRNYHPDDVELWLVDYKAVEFHEYVANQPPHIKLVGLDRSKEFTKSVLDKIYSTMEERKRIIMEAGFQKIEEYKTHYGKNSMPRIILIIDEAHVLSQHLSEDDKYRQLFENILSEYRAFGLSIILSDQAYKNSMKGITEKGRDQIGVRIAMKNSMDEIHGTLEVDHAYYQDSNLKNKINTLSTGDSIFRWFEAIDDGSARLHLDKVKAIYADRENDRKSIIDKSKELVNNTNFEPKETFIIVGKNRSSVFSKFNPFNSMPEYNEIPKNFSIYLGTPSSLEPAHKITVRKKKSSNVIFVCNNEEMQTSVSLFSALNFYKMFNMNIFVMAADGRISDDFKDYFYSIFSNKLFIAENEVQYNEALDKIKDCENCFIVWFGIDEILDEMEMREKSPNQRNSRSSVSNNDFSDLDEILNNSKINSQLKSTTTNIFFDRSNEIIDLLDKGSAFGKFSLVVADNMKELVGKKSIKMDFFEHKLAFNISGDESIYLFGKSKTIELDSELKNSTVIYSDGLEYSILRPYIVEDKLKSIFNDKRG